MPHPHLIRSSLIAIVLLTGGCSLDMTGLGNIGSGIGGGCCVQQAPPCMTSCPAMDPFNPRVLQGDTIDMFYDGGGVIASWTYDPTAFRAVQPPDVVKHHGHSVSHIELIATAEGSHNVKAIAGLNEGVMEIEAVPATRIASTGVTAFQCYEVAVNSPLCDGTKHPWDTASFKTNQAMKAVSVTWDRNGGLVIASAVWSSSNPAVAVIGRSYSEYDTAWIPTIVATGPGTTTISATAAGFTGTVDVTVAK